MITTFVNRKVKSLEVFFGDSIKFGYKAGKRSMKEQTVEFMKFISENEMIIMVETSAR